MSGYGLWRVGWCSVWVDSVSGYVRWRVGWCSVWVDSVGLGRLKTLSGTERTLAAGGVDLMCLATSHIGSVLCWFGDAEQLASAIILLHSPPVLKTVSPPQTLNGRDAEPSHRIRHILHRTGAGAARNKHFIRSRVSGVIVEMLLPSGIGAGPSKFPFRPSSGSVCLLMDNEFQRLKPSHNATTQHPEEANKIR